ncbi:MAG TPA: protein TolQ [Desulfobacter postgatei]|jgi:biopolymer transport protein TolQ|uniref:protein TolQ n=1 Tax=unclassified Desulfobacter TaxID=2634406 RepID=UPI000E7D7D31|nr:MULTISPECIES: protein TolQ [unclassified Desulfobacter]MDQ1270960.1 Protein TolQ [Thermodesulfobacteriota bacterium]HRF91136.1 protein TolQ [Desulfobacter postgatei]MBP8829014.1 protein TolQ [Desulfobacter sp.]MBP9597910.1 protein TolQ [Desulfobacter sp.]HBT87637.1 protein TolQ [Desulfobacter sp.]
MTTESVGLLYMITNAGPVVKFIMLLLLFFSIISWSIIFIKFRYVRKSFKDSADFTEVFWQCRTLADAFSKAKMLRSSPLGRIFIAAYMEASRTENKENLASKKNSGSTFQTMGSVKRTLNRAINVENRRLTQLISFLATAGNTAPFIGLFGTVWGIMSTFQGIGLSGSASLAVVAPGISEALVATAAGLAVAIPAVIAYNYFNDRTRVLNSELQSFSSDLLNIIERDVLKKLEA